MICPVYLDISGRAGWRDPVELRCILMPRRTGDLPAVITPSIEDSHTLAALLILVEIDGTPEASQQVVTEGLGSTADVWRRRGVGTA